MSRFEHGRDSSLDLPKINAHGVLCATIKLTIIGLLTSACPSKPKEEGVSTKTQAEITTVAPTVEMGAETKEALDYQKIAAQLEPYGEKMDTENKARLEKVVALLKNDLKGITLKRSTFYGEKNVRALTDYASNPRDPGLTVEINETWDPNNGADLVLLAHELLHVAEIQEAKKTLSEENWWKQYALEGKSIEIRRELAAWEFMLVLLNAMVDGQMDEFINAMQYASDEDSANRTLEEHLEKISQKMNMPSDQKVIIKRWLQIYFNYKLHKKNNLDCKWSYNFVMQVAGEYMNAGITVYELNQPDTQNGAHPDACVYPLGEGPYDSGIMYERKPNGTIGLGKTMRFNRKQD